MSQDCMRHQIVLRTVTLMTPAASAKGWPCRLAARHQLGLFTALSSFCSTSPVTNSTSVSVHGHPTSHQYHRGGLNPARSSLVDRCSASLSSPSASLPVHTTQTRQNSDNAAGQACDTFLATSLWRPGAGLQFGVVPTGQRLSPTYLCFR